MLTPSLNTVMPRLLIAAAVLVALALAVALFAPAASAQEGLGKPVEYAENGTGSVITFTSDDPEKGGIDWDVTGLDADDFTIDDRGVLMFKKSPNFEGPTDRERKLNTDTDFADYYDPDNDNADSTTGVVDQSAGTAIPASIPSKDREFAGKDNNYQIVVRATEQKPGDDDPRALSTETRVTVQVTDVNEDGTVKLDLLQPEVGTPITASLSDPDTTDEQRNDATWQWYVSKVSNPNKGVDDHWIQATGSNNATDTYTPAGDTVASTEDSAVDEGKYLRVVATYADSKGTGKKARAMSANVVRKEVSSAANGSPGFSSSGDYTRTVSESIAVGSPVGVAVVATDPNSDTLTYSLDDDRDTDDPVTTGDLRFFRIDQATGQLYVKKKLSYEAELTTTYIGKKPPVDGEYKFFVRATDPSGETAEVEVTVNATDANDAPVINGSWTGADIATNNNPTTQPSDYEAASSTPSELRVNEKDDDDKNPDDAYTGAPQMTVPGVLGSNNVFTASDEDARGQIIWDLEGEDEDLFVLTNTSADPTTGLRGPDEPVTLRFKSAPDYEDPKDANKDSVYKVTLVATDSGGAKAERPLTIFVNNVNEKGKVDLTDDQPYTDDPITAEVVDPDNGVAVITWQWTKAISTAHFSTTDNLNTIGANETVIHGATSDTYTPRGKSSSYAGDEGYYLMVRATYTDTTSRSDDPSTTNIDERTQKVVGGSNVAQIPSVTGDPVGPNDRTYRVAAISKNAVGVNPKTPGTLKFSADSYDRTVAENSEVGSVVGDPVRIDENGITYSLSDTTSGDDDYFTIDANTGQIRVGKVDFPNPVPAGVDGNCDTDTNTSNIATCPSEADPSLDYETKKSYTLTVTATDAVDSRGKGTATVNVTLDDLNESPYFDKVTRERAEAITYVETRKNAVMQLAVTEPDGSGLEWEVVGTDAADFTLADADSIPGEDKKRKDLMFKSQPDFENPTDRAHNADGLPAVNPDAGDDAAENGTYKVTVRVTETEPAAGPRKSAELDVTVTLADSDEKGSAYLTLLQPEVGTPIGYVASDPDGTVTVVSQRWYYAKVANPDMPTDTTSRDAQWTEISGDTGDDATYTPVAGQVGKKLLVWLTYNDGTNDPNTGGGDTSAAVSEHPVRKDVSDDANNSPDFATDKAAREIAEDKAVPGAKVGDPVDLVNEDVGEILTYDLDNDSTFTDANTDGIHDALPTAGDHTFFEIDRATGQIMVAEGKKLSAEETDGRNYGGDNPSTAGKYVFWVRAMDPSGEGRTITDPNTPGYGENRDEIEVTVTVTDVNEAPTVRGMSELFVNEVDESYKADGKKGDLYLGLQYRVNPANNTQYLAASNSNSWVIASTTLASTTSDNLYKRAEEDEIDGASWPAVGGADGHLFDLNSAPDGIGRLLRFKQGKEPNFEKPMDADKDNVYEVTIKVTDNAGAEGSKSVRITVLNLDEKGKVSFSTDDPTDDAPLVATVDDPDGGVIYTNWIWFHATTSNTIYVGTTDTPPYNAVSMFPDDDNTDGNANHWSHIATSTSGSYKGRAGDYLWVRVDYRDGASVEDDPVTALDERNDNPATIATGDNIQTNTEQHKLAPDDGNVDPPVSDGLLTDAEMANTDDGDRLDHNSDEMLAKLASSAVRGNGGAGGGTGPSTDRVDVTLSVPENTPSTGYIGAPIKELEYNQSASVKALRDTVGGPDVDNFGLAEEYDLPAAGYYDAALAPSTDIDDKKSQLVMEPATILDYETKKIYVVEIIDPDAAVSVGAVRVTINVTDVNEAPTAPKELRGPPPVRNVAPDFAATSTTRSVAENSATGTPVGAPVSATDADEDPITYSLGTTTDDMAFDISTSTGQISTKAPLDYETKSSYSVTVTATDDDDASSSIMVTIMVTDVGLGDAVHGYDANEDDKIDSGEVLQAVSDYFDGTIGQTEVLVVVAQYFADLPASGS